MQNKRLKKYVLEDDMYLDDSDGLYILFQEYTINNTFEIVENRLIIKEHIKKKFGLNDNDGLRAIIFTAFSMIIWEEEYVIDDSGVEYTVFVGKDIDEEDYYAIKVRTGSMREGYNDDNGGTIYCEAEEPFKQIINRYDNDLCENREILFKNLQSFQDNLREGLMKFKNKPKFRKWIDV